MELISDKVLAPHHVPYNERARTGLGIRRVDMARTKNEKKRMLVLLDSYNYLVLDTSMFIKLAKSGDLNLLLLLNIPILVPDMVLRESQDDPTRTDSQLIRAFIQHGVVLGSVLTPPVLPVIVETEICRTFVPQEKKPGEKHYKKFKNSGEKAIRQMMELYPTNLRYLVLHENGGVPHQLLFGEPHFTHEIDADVMPPICFLELLYERGLIDAHLEEYWKGMLARVNYKEDGEPTTVRNIRDSSSQRATRLYVETLPRMRTLPSSRSLPQKPAPRQNLRVYRT